MWFLSERCQGYRGVTRSIVTTKGPLYESFLDPGRQPLFRWKVRGRHLFHSGPHSRPLESGCSESRWTRSLLKRDAWEVGSPLDEFQGWCTFQDIFRGTYVESYQVVSILLRRSSSRSTYSVYPCWHYEMGLFHPSRPILRELKSPLPSNNSLAKPNQGFWIFALEILGGTSFLIFNQASSKTSCIWKSSVYA